jgi:hypothetical protein
MFTVPGHNDGLRVVGENDLWALHNEDANPNLVVMAMPALPTFQPAPSSRWI